jgi:hypothetical protein
MYDSASPYSKTYINGDYLDLMNPRYIVHEDTDDYYTIEPKYDMRPDLLAHIKFGTVRYWWVFTLRNKSILLDPIQDFRAGITIRIPKLKNIR